MFNIFNYPALLATAEIGSLDTSFLFPTPLPPRGEFGASFLCDGRETRGRGVGASGSKLK